MELYVGTSGWAVSDRWRGMRTLTSGIMDRMLTGHVCWWGASEIWSIRIRTREDDGMRLLR